MKVCCKFFFLEVLRVSMNFVSNDRIFFFLYEQGKRIKMQDKLRGEKSRTPAFILTLSTRRGDTSVEDVKAVITSRSALLQTIHRLAQWCRLWTLDSATWQHTSLNLRFRPTSANLRSLSAAKDHS